MTRPEIPRPLSNEGQFRIAAVSGLTGIPVATIRIWESRYGVVRPARSGGNTRLYSRADVDRLMLLRAAVDAGFQIGTVAALDDEQLRERLQVQPHRLQAAPDRQARAVICGESLAVRLASAWTGAAAIAIAGVLAEVGTPADALVESLSSAGEAVDFLIVDRAGLDVAGLQALRRLRGRLRPQVTVVVYTYATRRALLQLDEEGVIALGAPADPAHLARICRMGRMGLMPGGDGLTAVERLLREPAAPRRYELGFLARLRDLPTRVQCECPNHLAELLSRLNAFEQYSLDCESRSEADAVLHGRLHAAASHCREVLEHVLHEVLDAEGIAQPGRG